MIELASSRAKRALERALADRNAQLAIGGIVAVGDALARHATLLWSRRDGDSGPSRKYRIKSGEDAADGLRRAAVGRLDDAVDQICARGESDAGAAVHETRKDLKKTRSILRLVRDRIGEDVYRRENDRFGSIARLLAGTRDAHVKRETLDALAERYPEALTTGWSDFSEVLAAEASIDPDPARLERAREEVVAGRAEVEAWPLGDGEWELVAGGLARSYRRGRKRFTEVRDHPSNDAVHEWRKRVKDLWYHQRLLEKSWDPVLGETAEQTHELADLLGDHHDLAVLGEDARSRSQLLGEDELAALAGLIGRRQDELLEDAMELAERIYAEKPKRYIRRFERYWTAWR